MSESALPEPTVVDEEKARELQHLIDDAVLRPKPYGEEKCRSCLYYLDTDTEFSYCWHPKIRILVSGEWWWCQWWEELADD